MIVGIRFSPIKVPAALVLVVGGLLASVCDHRPGGGRVLLIEFSQTAGDARSFASKHQYRIDIDQESVAQGMANVGSGLVQGIPVSTSLSASSLNDESGARRRWRRSPPASSSC